uniref:Inositol polyphosphate-related phosphatase domain-containing protein n=2 Tax=Kalanchoe fedtschenkoi TaxID=63787 RepID=A0A7N0RBY0_KALFE
MSSTNDVSRKKPFVRRLFSRRERNMSNGPLKGPSPGRPETPRSAQASSTLKSLFSFRAESPSPQTPKQQPFRIFVATWNVGGIPPHNGLNLDEFLQVEDQPEADMYVLGFQEIVPLNAGNVLVVEDHEPAAKWLDLINQSLNKSSNTDIILTAPSTSFTSADTLVRSVTPSRSHASLFFPKTSLKRYSKSFRTEEKRKLKTCNCSSDAVRKSSRDSCFRCQQAHFSEEEYSSEEEDDGSSVITDVSNIVQGAASSNVKYGLIVSKQMVGIFVTIWVKKELVQYIGHMRTSCIGRGILGYLGNKGCISVSFSFHQTSFCFICSHLASGEKEGDELRRNSDVIEILRSTQFRRVCRTTHHKKVPERILDHDRVIWFGDLNYRIALSYADTKKLLEENAWDALLGKDQLKIEREAGRVFKGWKEGKIYFAPTYKYSYNSDIYAGETISSKQKRRTPAWCDRILWHGSGIRESSYIRGESRFSDHRPVCANFFVDVGVVENVGGSKRRSSSACNMKVGAEELLPKT